VSENAVPAKETFEASTARRSIPSLDGLRAVSIMLVILSHLIAGVPDSYQHFWVIQWMLANGRLGVAVFFVISGYLITLLLLNELDTTNTISLRRFYLRRALRIFPAFYVFLSVMAILWITGIIPEHLPSFIAAATYTWALFPNLQGYYINHSWSLSIEEQFYLIWPFLLRRLRRQRATRFAITAILCMPLVRFAMYWLTPGLRGHDGFMVQAWVDTMMIGCLLALLKGPQWELWKQRYISHRAAAVVSLLAFLVLPYLRALMPGRPGGAFGLILYFSIQPLAIGFMLLYVIRYHDSIVGRFLNHPVVKHIGVISYSIYLWQQLFTDRDRFPAVVALCLILAVAEVSYWMVERPALKLRSRLDAWLMPRPSYRYGKQS
jgi:peptidoglycan/LPS O-acetylase OafA/YrhL